MSSAVQLFYLQDAREHAYVGDGLAFHCKAGAGYATDLDKAQLWTLEDAVKANQMRSTDIPWPKDYIDARAHRGVDCQYLKANEPDARVTPGCRIVFQVPGHWNGNDVYWVYAAGGRGPVFDHAVDVEYIHALEYTPWPLDYVRTKARRLVHRQNVSTKEALRGTGIKLFKEKLYKPPTCRCEHCGRFISDGDRFVPCPNCGGDNAP